MEMLIQIDAFDPVAVAAVTLYASSRDDDRVCHLNGQTWFPAISRLPVLRYDFFDGSFGRQIEAPSSGVFLSIEPWPNFPRYAFTDARIQIWTGNVGDAWGSWVQRFDGRVTAQPKVSSGQAEIYFAVDDRWLDAPLLPTYAGTTGTEGAASQKGQAKPLALGAPRFVPGVLIDQTNTVVQVSSAGLIEDIEVAFDALSQFPTSVGDFASYAALVAATIAPGFYATAKAVGLVRHGAPFAGRPSYHVKGDKSGPDAWARTPGKIIRRLALLSGGTGKYSDTSLNALDTARPWNISLYLDQQSTAREMVQRVAASVNAVAGVSWLGKLFAAPVDIGTPSITLAADGSALPPVASVDQIDVGPPWWRLAQESERTWQVHALNEIAYAAELLDLGTYSATTTYRDGNIVYQPADGNRYLYVNATPTAGNAPPNVTYWTLYQERDTSIAAVLDGTVLYRTSGAPTNKPYPLSVTTTTNANATVNYTITWDHYQQGALPAEFIVIFWKKGTGAPTVTDAAIQLPVNQAWQASYIFEGVNPADTMSFGIAAGRRTPRGIEITAITSFAGGGSWTNLLLQSQAIDNASWTKVGATVTANATTAPDGTTTADRLASSVSTGSNTAYASQQVTVSTATDYVYSVYLKPGTSPLSTVNFYRVSPFAQALLTITWGTTPTISFTGVGFDYGLFDLGNGWYRAWIALNSATATALMARVYTRDTGTTHVSGEYVDMWGAMVDTATTARPYVPTTTGTASLTNPNMQSLGGGTVSFTGNIGSTPAGTIESNTLAAFNGTVAYRTTGAPTNAPYPISLPVPTQNSNGTVNWTLTWDHYVQGAKQADALVLYWRKDGTAPTVNDASITMTVNTGWRSYYVMEGVSPADTYSFGLAAARRTEIGWEVGPIIAFDGSQSRTNIVLQSRAFGTTWVTSATTVSSNPAGITAPDGNTLVADKLVEAATTAAHYISQSTTVTSGQVYQESVYVLAGERSIFQIAALTGTSGGLTAYQNFDLANGVLGAGTGFAAVGMQPLGGGWFRCWVEDTATAAAASFALAIVPAATSARLASYLGDITKGLYLWGAQRELKTAYLTNAGPSPWMGTTTGTVTVTGPDMLGVTVGTPLYNGNVGSSGTNIPATSVSSTINSGGGVATNNVSTAAVQANAVTGNASAYTAASMALNTTYQTIQTVTITTTGGTVAVFASFRGSGSGSIPVIQWQLKRGSTVVVSGINGGSYSPESYTFSETPAAGTYTYTLEAIATSGTWSVDSRSLVVLELKR